MGSDIKIFLPADASAKDLQLLIEKVKDTRSLLKHNEVLASPVYELLKNVAENFNVPVTITFVFDQKSIGDNRKAVVFYYDEAKKMWVEIGGKVTGNQYRSMSITSPSLRCLQ
ncbi:hypothetical protein [Paenibacillus glycinis]|uniref:Uncharacterized protein n=1 Tax=Paenibacillus glycinis TaxID=2697035 RepID=A0ABW9XLR2_9BACL|nr:hypothetical protein [Paenibacillus glycinis]NBD23551.1 hypothetical protein [Paenibacillus glycinis]